MANFHDVGIVDYLSGNYIGNMNPGARFQNHLTPRELMLHNSDLEIALALEKLLSRVFDRIDADFERGQVATSL